MKHTLSIAIATFNEEHNLERCLASVSFADEIVVVDGGSTDRTIEIARTYDAQIIIADNPPIFHLNKQKAIDACTSDWILQLDADEEVTAEFRDELLSTIDSISPSCAGYFISRKNQLLGKWMMHGGMYPDYVVRLFKNGTGLFPSKSVHEQIVVKGNIGYLKQSLVHRPYPTFSEYLRKANVYTTLTADQMEKDKVAIGFYPTVFFLFIKPCKTFLTLYIRHRGFRDGFAGLVWALFSALHHPIAYIKYWEKKQLH